MLLHFVSSYELVLAKQLRVQTCSSGGFQPGGCTSTPRLGPACRSRPHGWSSWLWPCCPARRPSALGFVLLLSGAVLASTWQFLGKPRPPAYAACARWFTATTSGIAAGLWADSTLPPEPGAERRSCPGPQPGPRPEPEPLFSWRAESRQEGSIRTPRRSALALARPLVRVFVPAPVPPRFSPFASLSAGHTQDARR